LETCPNQNGPMNSAKEPNFCVAHPFLVSVLTGARRCPQGVGVHGSGLAVEHGPRSILWSRLTNPAARRFSTWRFWLAAIRLRICRWTFARTFWAAPRCCVASRRGARVYSRPRGALRPDRQRGSKAQRRGEPDFHPLLRTGESITKAMRLWVPCVGSRRGSAGGR